MTAGQLSRESWWPSPSLDEREPQWRLVRRLVHAAQLLRHLPVLVGVAGVSDQIVVSVHLKPEDVAAGLKLRRGPPPTAGHLIRVWNVGTAVAGISHFVSVPVPLIHIGDALAVVQVIENP